MDWQERSKERNNNNTLDTSLSLYFNLFRSNATLFCENLHDKFVTKQHGHLHFLHYPLLLLGIENFGHVHDFHSISMANLIIILSNLSWWCSSNMPILLQLTSMQTGAFFMLAETVKLWPYQDLLGSVKKPLNMLLDFPLPTLSASKRLALQFPMKLTGIGTLGATTFGARHMSMASMARYSAASIMFFCFIFFWKEWCKQV